MWFGALLPRVHAFIPTGTILEIAPGYGRWTQYLKESCQRLVVVDMAENCIEHCKRRFATSTNVEYHVNDGRSLEMIAPESVDFVFSFDSLVHADRGVLSAYLEQLAAKLTPNGVGFFHHSNLGSYPRARAFVLKLPPPVAHRLIQRGRLIDLHAWREEGMTADVFRELCTTAGLKCVGQESINWEKGPFLIDTLSMFTRPGSRWDRSYVGIRNPHFRADAQRTARLYARSSFPA
jgi:SAM-dependent methyltransferase